MTRPRVTPLAEGEAIEKIALSPTAKTLLFGVGCATLGIIIGYNVKAILDEQKREKVDEITPSPLHVVADYVAEEGDETLEEETGPGSDEPSTTVATAFVKPDLDINAVTSNGKRPDFGATKSDTIDA